MTSIGIITLEYSLETDVSTSRICSTSAFLGEIMSKKFYLSNLSYNLEGIFKSCSSFESASFCNNSFNDEKISVKSVDISV